MPPHAGDASAAPGETFAIFKDGRKLPLFSTQSDLVPVAKVGTDVVTLGELTEALAVMHEEKAGNAGDKNFGVVLDRLVEVHLVALEARNMGIPDLPEFKSQMAMAEEKALREALRQEVGATAKANPKDVEKGYREATKEWQVRSILFASADDAKRFAAALEKGAPEALFKQAVAEKKAQGNAEPAFVRDVTLAQPIRDAIRKLQTGQVSPPIKLGTSTTYVQLLGSRQANDPGLRASVERTVKQEARLEVLKDYYKQLAAKHAKVDRALLKKLNFDVSKERLDKLEKDQRVLADVPGEKPLRVADLTVELRKKYFHGAERQAKEGKLNKQKQTTFDDMLEKRLFTKEARAQKLQERPDVKRQLKDFADQLAVAAAIERAVVPDVKATDADARGYYDAHKQDFSTPAMLKLEALAFEKASDAQDAFKKLRAGTDFKWVAANSSGQLDPAKRNLVLDGDTFSVPDLPGDLGDALAGAKTNDYRLYSDAARGGHYVIHVLEAFPSQVPPFESVKETVTKRAYADKLNATFRDWTAKLRQHYPVEILIAKFGS
jgi:hypothetical protein